MKQLAWVEWTDSTSYRGWNIPDDIGVEATLRTVGWLIEERDTALVLSASKDTDNKECLDPIVIPKGSVTRWGLVDMEWE